MLASDPKIQEQIAALYKIASRLRRGDLLTHDQIRSVVGVEPHEGQWDHIVGQVRRKLEREKSIATWVRPQDIRVGYALLTIAEQLYELPTWRTAKAGRQFKRARNSIRALSDKDLSLHQRRMRHMQEEAMKEQQAAVRKLAKYQAAIGKGIAVAPRMPMVAMHANQEA